MSEQYVRPYELVQMARVVREANGLSLRGAATRLGVSATTVHRAEDVRHGRRYSALQVRMLVELGGAEVEGPLWRVRTPHAQASGGDQNPTTSDDHNG